ncbi:MAG: hypothetical protein ACKOQ6_13875, partial [Bacteroidota bacterium]
KTTMELFDASEDLAFLNERVYVSAQQARLLADSAQGSLKKSLLSYAVKMDTIRKELVATKPGLAITGEEMIRERLSELYSGVLSYRGRPSDSQLDKFTRLLGEIDVQQQKADAVWSKDLPALNAGLQKAGLEQIKLITREQFDKKLDDGSLGGNKNWNYRNIWVY